MSVYKFELQTSQKQAFVNIDEFSIRSHSREWCEEWAGRGLLSTHDGSSYD